MQEIINITQYGDALRNTGYKNIESTVSEIIDNSLEHYMDTMNLSNFEECFGRYV